MKITRWMALLVGICTFLFVSQASAAYSVVSVTSATVGPFTRTVTTVQDGASSFERFKVYRVKKMSAPTGKPILLTPSIVGGFREYEVSWSASYLSSFVGVLASAGYDVWGISQRADGLLPGTCEASPSPCGPMANWGLATLLADVAYVRGQIASVHGVVDPAVGGFSMGAALGFAAANAAPADYAGIIAVEGGLYQTDAAAKAYASTWCTVTEAQLTAGVYYEAAPQSQKGVAAQYLASPTPANAVTFRTSLVLPVPSPFSFRPGYRINDGDPFQLTYADLVHAARVLVTYNDYASVRTLRDLQCSLAGTDTSFVSALGSFSGHVFAHVAGNGFGPIVTDTAALTSAAIDLHSYPLYAHRDADFGTAHAAVLEAPLLTWLASVL